MPGADLAHTARLLLSSDNCVSAWLNDCGVKGRYGWSLDLAALGPGSDHRSFCCPWNKLVHFFKNKQTTTRKTPQKPVDSF